MKSWIVHACCWRRRMLCKIKFILHNLLVLLLLTDGPRLTYHCLVTKVMTMRNEYLHWVFIVETVSVLTVILWFRRLAARLAITTSQILQLWLPLATFTASFWQASFQWKSQQEIANDYVTMGQCSRVGFA